MANKTHHRYKLRKTAKSSSARLFSEPPVLISTWEELVGLETEDSIIEVDLEMYSGYVVPKVKPENGKDCFLNEMYLSTHTFYGSQYSQTTEYLRKRGFNIQLANWDGETVYCKN